LKTGIPMTRPMDSGPFILLENLLAIFRQLPIPLSIAGRMSIHYPAVLEHVHIPWMADDRDMKHSH
jgi:hypothetical protein